MHLEPFRGSHHSRGEEVWVVDKSLLMGGVETPGCSKPALRAIPHPLIRDVYNGQASMPGLRCDRNAG